MDKATLVGKKVVPEADLFTFARWYETADRRVGFTRLSKSKRRNNFVSTVFLGMDHGFAKLMGGDGPSLWFETMIFGTSMDQYQERYETWEEAARGHAGTRSLSAARDRRGKSGTNPIRDAASKGARESFSPK